MTEYITILGATGSIGISTLDIIADNRNKFKVFGVSGNKNLKKMIEICEKFIPKYAFMFDDNCNSKLKNYLKNKNYTTEVLQESNSLEFISSHKDVSQVVSGIVGIAGLSPTLSAIKSGKKILLANKESLVTAGSFFMDLVAKHNATLVPIDSEHNAIFQCIENKKDIQKLKGIEKILITASGGPFLNHEYKDLENITVQQACNHPNWSMGRKISIDSSTMMNKALEVVEAYWLFGQDVNKLDVLVHPQSIIHSMVKYIDGSFLAQLGSADMKTPIGYGLFYPNRGHVNVKPLDFMNLNLTFQGVDKINFPIIDLTFKLLKNKDFAGLVVMNSVNEVMVDKFLNNEIKYIDIIKNTIDFVKNHKFDNPKSIEDVIQIDKVVRDFYTKI